MERNSTPESTQLPPYKADEVAELFGVSRALVYRLGADEQLKVVRIGNRVLFDRESIDARLAGETH